jgi:hypothetical protein
VRVAGVVAGISLGPQIRSDRELRSDSDSTLVPMLKSSNVGERRWSPWDEDTELATMRPVGNDKMGVGTKSPVTVKSLPPLLLHERCSQWGWL